MSKRTTACVHNLTYRCVRFIPPVLLSVPGIYSTPQRPFTEWLPSALRQFFHPFSPSFIRAHPPHPLFSHHKILPRATSSPFYLPPYFILSCPLLQMSARTEHQLTQDNPPQSLHLRSFKYPSIFLICYRNWKFTKKVKTCCVSCG